MTRRDAWAIFKHTAIQRGDLPFSGEEKYFMVSKYRELSKAKKKKEKQSVMIKEIIRKGRRHKVLPFASTTDRAYYERVRNFITQWRKLVEPETSE